jgi:hypothetical protein
MSPLSSLLNDSFTLLNVELNYKQLTKKEGNELYNLGYFNTKQTISYVFWLLYYSV